MHIPFSKMHGLGNSYIYINMFTFQLPEEMLPKLARKMADVYTGIGADGMVLICPSQRAEVKMRIFNKDGSEGKNCGYALRCVAKYVYEQGMVRQKQFQIEIGDRLVKAVIHGETSVETVTIHMGRADLDNASIPIVPLHLKPQTIGELLDFGTFSFVGTAVSMGNPHIVFIVDHVSEILLEQVGPVIETHPMFPQQVNAEFVQIISDNKICMRVWERGSGITKACGTGACAAVVAATLLGYVKKNTDITVVLDGGELQICYDEDEQVYMTGSAIEICTGQFFYQDGKK